MRIKSFGQYPNGNKYVRLVGDAFGVTNEYTHRDDVPIEIYELILKETELANLETCWEYADEQKREEIKLKKMEIEAMNENTKAQKELAETVLSAMTYLAQLLKK